MMQKKFFLMTIVFSVCVILFVFCVPANEVPEPIVGEKVIPEKKDDPHRAPGTAPDGQRAEAVPFQWQYLPLQNFYINDHQRRVNGLALGYCLTQNEINGVSMALIHAYNKRKSGFSMSFLEYSAISEGMAVFMAGGVQYNNGFALALLNMTEKNQGVQLGMVNLEEKNLLMEYDMKPQESQDKFGVQIGVVNYSDAPGIQFGLWNTNPKSLIKHFPLFNICW